MRAIAARALSSSSPRLARWLPRRSPGKKENLRETKDAGNRGCTYADFCSLAATLVAFTCAVARTVVWAATANILTEKGVGVLRDGGCRNDPRPDLVAGFASMGF